MKNPAAFLDEQLARLFAMWPVSAEKARTLRREYAQILAEVGPQRFEQGVSRFVREFDGQFLPPLAVFRGYVPDGGGRSRRCSRCAPCDGFLYFDKQDRHLPYGELHLHLREIHYVRACEHAEAIR
jgi:hypothetical protein